MEEPERVYVAADRSILWRELVHLIGPPSVFVGLFWIPSSDGDLDLSLPWVAAIWVTFALPWGLFGAVPRWIRHRRTIVEASADRLVVRSGTRVLLDLRRQDIVQIRVRGRADWSSLMFPFNHHPGPFPVLTVWSSERWESPPLFLWGKASIQLERDLNRVLEMPRYHG